MSDRIKIELTGEWESEDGTETKRLHLSSLTWKDVEDEAEFFRYVKILAHVVRTRLLMQRDGVYARYE